MSDEPTAKQAPRIVVGTVVGCDGYFIVRLEDGEELRARWDRRLGCIFTTLLVGRRVEVKLWPNPRKRPVIVKVVKSEEH